MLMSTLIFLYGTQITTWSNPNALTRARFAVHRPIPSRVLSQTDPVPKQKEKEKKADGEYVNQ
jgi:hypothetical protein